MRRMEKLELTSQIRSIICYSRIIIAKTSLFIFPLFSTRYSVSFVHVSNIDLPLSIDLSVIPESSLMWADCLHFILLRAIEMVANFLLLQ